MPTLGSRSHMVRPATREMSFHLDRFFFFAFFAFGLSFSGLGDVLSAPFSAASTRAWACFSLFFVVVIIHASSPRSLSR
jgi:hypothetical protein